MELVSKLMEMIPWRRKPIETYEIASLQDDINRLFDRFLASFGPDWFPTRGWWPRFDRGWWSGFDIEETDDEVIVRAEVPGIEPKDLDVSVRDGVLHVRYQKAEEYHGNGGYWRRSYGAFSRSVALPTGLDFDRSKAECRHGILTVRIPRTLEAKERIRRIPVQA